MKKFLTLLLALACGLTCTFSFAACGGGDEEGPTKSATANVLTVEETDIATKRAVGWIREDEPEVVENTGAGIFYAIDVCVYSPSRLLTGITLRASDFTCGGVQACSLTTLETFENVTDPYIDTWEPYNFGAVYVDGSYAELPDGGFTETYGSRLDLNSPGNHDCGTSTASSIDAREVWRVVLFFEREPSYETVEYNGQTIETRSIYNSAINHSDFAVTVGSNTLYMCLNGAQRTNKVYEAVSGQYKYTYTEEIDEVLESTVSCFVKVEGLTSDFTDKVYYYQFSLEVNGETIECKNILSEIASVGADLDEATVEAEKESIMQKYGLTDPDLDFYTFYIERDEIHYVNPNYSSSISESDTVLLLDFGLTEKPESFKLFLGDTEITVVG